MPARRALRMATLDGARAIGLADQIGSIETGKLADITVLDLGRLHLTPRPDLVSTIVYAAEAQDVRTVLVGGRALLRDGQLTTLDEREVLAEAREQHALLAARADLPV